MLFKRNKHQAHPSPQEALKELREQVEEVKEEPIEVAEEKLGVSNFAKDGDTAGYLSPQEYIEVKKLPAE